MFCTRLRCPFVPAAADAAAASTSLMNAIKAATAAAIVLPQFFGIAAEADEESSFSDFN